MKSKPTQMSVKELRGCGLTPDVVSINYPYLFMKSSFDQLDTNIVRFILT